MFLSYPLLGGIGGDAVGEPLSHEKADELLEGTGVGNATFRKKRPGTLGIILIAKIRIRVIGDVLDGDMAALEFEFHLSSSPTTSLTFLDEIRTETTVVEEP